MPLNVPSLRQAIQIGELFNGRSTYTTAEPLVIKLNRGLYDEGNGLHRLQFNLVLQGAGKQFTWIKNGIYIRGDNRNHLHTAFQVVLKDLTVGLALNERFQILFFKRHRNGGCKCVQPSFVLCRKCHYLWQ